MELNECRRRKELIAANMDELREFATHIEVDGHKGFPVWLLPFQCTELHGKRVESLSELEKVGPYMLDSRNSKDGGWFGYVHVFKTW